MLKGKISIILKDDKFSIIEDYLDSLGFYEIFEISRKNLSMKYQKRDLSKGEKESIGQCKKWVKPKGNAF